MCPPLVPLFSRWYPSSVYMDSRQESEPNTSCPVVMVLSPGMYVRLRQRCYT